MTADANAPTVFLVDDDRPVLKAQARLLREHGFQTVLFESAEDFLAEYDATVPGCLVLDVNLPGLDGLALQRRLAEVRPSLPIVFLTGTGDIPKSVQAVKAGAVDFLTKPVAGAIFVAAVRAAVTKDALARLANDDDAALRQRHASLSAREREVLAGLAAGKLNKQIAGELGLAEATVKFHRAHLMESMRAHTVAELMYLAARLELSPADSPATQPDEEASPPPPRR